MISRTIFLLILLACFYPVVSVAQESPGHSLETFNSYQSALEHSQLKLSQTLEELDYNPELHPAQTNQQTGKWEKSEMGRETWTSGFFSGSMWYMYKLTGDDYWKEHAAEWTKDLEPVAYNTYDHDTGFRIFNSFGNAYQLLGDRYYYKQLLQGAHTLSKRYNPNVGAIKSWDWVGNFPVIIDNLMNLELLLWSSEKTGNDKWHTIALNHAATTLEHHVRPDGSTYHIVDFDNSGNINWKDTFQGYGPESVWSRGQSWAIYGFTMIYRFSKDPKFLEIAEKTALYFINHLPGDHVPPYDFLEQEPSVKTKDASAAAVSASGLFELYTITKNPLYFNTAVGILESLSSGEYSTVNSHMSSILKNSTLHRGHSNIGTSYADYYYLEAIVRYREIMEETFPPIEQQYSFYLDQNYPNPFNNSTSIYYSIEEEGNVELSIYNMAGRKVQTLINQFRTEGTYRADFDASGLSSGLYLYRLTVNGQTTTRKMILLQ